MHFQQLGLLEGPDMFKDYVHKNFDRLVVGGIILQVLGRMIYPLTGYPILRLSGWVISLFGTMLLLVGFAFYVKSKGRHPAWCLFALLSVIGWIVIILLKDVSPRRTEERIW
jgi:hypothetical protein